MSDSERPDSPDLKDLELKPSWVSDLERRSGNRRESYGDQGSSFAPDRQRSGPRHLDGRRPNHSGDPDRRNRRGRRDHEPEPAVSTILRDCDFRFRPTARSVETLVEQIRRSARAYPVFDLAKVVLAAPDRFEIQIVIREESAGRTLFRCPFDGALFLTRDEAIRHIVASTAFNAVYRPQKVEVGSPKGNFPVVALCGLSGAVLGPPNYHAYAEKVETVHRERYHRMPFDDYRSRIRMSREDADIRRWAEEESWTTRYQHGEGDTELVFGSTKEALRHLMEHRQSEFLEICSEALVPGHIDPALISEPLLQALRHATHETRRHPLPFVRSLSDCLEGAGLKFFKQDRKFTFVTATRPRPLDSQTDFSARIAGIVAHLRQHPGITMAQAIASLAGPVEPPENRQLTQQEIDHLRDLRWLIREGHVIEFSNAALQLVDGRREKAGNPGHPPRPGNAAPSAVPSPAAVPESKPSPPADPNPPEPPSAESTGEPSSTGAANPEVS
ncbi:MAG TPA: hypothetical protein VMN36_17235 [Verrucomicrobiales bacterium]|nr:hypothetical protein [Verrucomicrobiales bacterium]